MKVDKTKWEKVAFSNAVKLAHPNGAVQKKDYAPVGLYPIVSQEKDLVSGYCDDCTNLNILSSPVIIFGDHTRIVKYVDFDFVVGADGVKVLVPTYSFDSKYLYYNLSWLKVPSNGYSRHFKFLRQQNVFKPSLPEQQAIATELDAIQSVIDKLQEQLRDYDTLAQSIFNEMFGDGLYEGRWQIKTIGDIAKCVNYGTSSPAEEGGKYIYLRMGNITDEGYLDLSDIKHINISDEDKEKYLVEKWDILFNRTNSRDKVGKTACFLQNEPMVIAGYIIRVRLKSEVVPIYVWRYLNTPAMKRHLKTIGRGSVGQANINSKELCSIPIPLPPISLQHQFAERVETIEAQKTLLRQQMADARQLMDSRMQYYFE